MVPLLAALAACVAASLGFLAGVATGRNLEVGNLFARPGEKVRAHVPVDIFPEDSEHHVSVPFALINGICPGKRVVITAGMHGGEYLGILAASRLVWELSPSAICGQVVISPVANPLSAFFRRDEYSDIDYLNINTEFPGQKFGQPTQRLAWWLFHNVIKGADGYVDLHSSATDLAVSDHVGYRLTSDDVVDAGSEAMAKSVGYGLIVRDAKLDNDGTSHFAAVTAGVPAIAIEAGDRNTRDGDRLENLIQGLLRLLHHFRVFANIAVPPQLPVSNWEWAGWVEAPAPGAWFPEQGPGSQVQQGDVIGYIQDVVTDDFETVYAFASGWIVYCLYAVTVVKDHKIAGIAVQMQNVPALEMA